MDFFRNRINVVVIFFAILIAVLAAYIVYKKVTKPAAPSPPSPPVVTALVAESDSSIPVDVHSPDGKMKVTMEKKTNTDNTSTFSLTVSDVSGGNPINIFKNTLSDGAEMSIPLNSFSPDNRYLFIRESNGSKQNFLVFKSTGEAFSDGNKYIDVVPLFDAKNTGLKLTDVTGWDSNTLLHVFTEDEKGERGPSFWFEIPDGAVIQLASS